jgi:hypothetical protein
MAISKVNAVASTSAPASLSFTAASSGTYYKGTGLSLPAGVYRVTCVSTTIATVNFFASGTALGAAVTSSGTVDISLTSPVTEILYSTNTGSSIGITIAYLATAVTPTTVSGTLDTYTSGSGTYTQTGNAYVLLVGGGGSGTFASSGGAGGGGSGGVLGASVVLTGSIAYSVGAKGAKQTSSGNSGNAGGSTTFGSLTATGGGGGSGSTGGTAGTPNGGRGANGARGQSPTASASSPLSFIVAGTTGGGGYGTQGDSRGGGTGSGIGTGGDGGQGGTGEASTNATGYGAGGGAGVGSQPPAEATGGVLYIFRY